MKQTALPFEMYRKRFDPIKSLTTIAERCQEQHRSQSPFLFMCEECARNFEDGLQKPLKWNRTAIKRGSTINVDCGSFGDWANPATSRAQKAWLWKMIRATPALDWLLLTRSDQDLEKHLPEDWGKGYPNVYLGVYFNNRKEALYRTEMLRQIPAQLRYVEFGPLKKYPGTLNLEKIDLGIMNFDNSGNGHPHQIRWFEYLLDQFPLPQ